MHTTHSPPPPPSPLPPQAMSSLLEFHDLELTRYSATYSPTARARLKAKEKERVKKHSTGERHVYKDAEINNCREEITKLKERVGLLRTHCEEAMEQVYVCVRVRVCVCAYACMCVCMCVCVCVCDYRPVKAHV